MAKSDRGRFSAKRKSQAVLRLLRGEDLDIVSRELGVKGATLAKWRERFLAHGEEGLRSRPRDERDARIEALQRKVGEITMTNELLEAKIDALEEGRPLARRRSKR